MSRLDYRRKKQREQQRRERGETGFKGFVKRHTGLLVLGALVICVCAASFAAVRNPDFGASLFGRSGTALYLDENTLFEMPYTGGDNNVIKTQGDSAVLCTRDKIMMVSSSGKTEWEISVRLNKPLVSVAGNYILAADRGGKDIYLISGGKLLLQTVSAYTIINACAADDGKFVVISDEPYYKGLVTVMDAGGDEVFVWHSGGFYIIDAAFGSDTNVIALAAVNTSMASEDDAAGGFSGNVLMFNLHDAEPFRTHSYEECLITNVFRAGSGFLAVTDKKTIGFSADGEQKWEYDYSDTDISRMARSSDLTVFAFEADSGRKNIVAVDNSGQKRCEISNAPNLSFISAEEDRIAYNSGGSIAVCDSSGKELYEIQTAKSFTDFLLFDGGKKAVGLTGSSLDILEIK